MTEINFKGLDKLVKVLIPLRAIFKPYQISRVELAKALAARKTALIAAQTELDKQAMQEGEKVFDFKEGSITALISGEKSAAASERVEPFISLTDLDNVHRTENLRDQVQKDINLASCASEAFKQLSETGDEEVSDESIDDDWLHVWRGNAEAVSNEHMQKVWGWILASETKSPGSNSLKTLDILRVLSVQDAELISKLSPYVTGDWVLLKTLDYLASRGLGLSEFLTLEELGIVTGFQSRTLARTFALNTNNNYATLLFSSNRKHALRVSTDNVEKFFQKEAVAITRAGKEILKLTGFEIDMDFYQIVTDILSEENVTLELADVFLQKGKDVEVTEPITLYTATDEA